MPDLIPWGALEISKLKGDVDKLVDALCEDFGLGQGACREAALRIIEADGEWVVFSSLPGVLPEDVTVTQARFEDGVLTVRLARLAESSPKAIPVATDQKKNSNSNGSAK